MPMGPPSVNPKAEMLPELWVEESDTLAPTTEIHSKFPFWDGCVCNLDKSNTMLNTCIKMQDTSVERKRDAVPPWSHK